jgi:hypothetical protein
MRPTCTPKHFKKSVIRGLIEQKLNWSFHVKKASREPINQKAGSGKGVTPETKRDKRMSKKS